jgi:hypothetical protein
MTCFKSPRGWECSREAGHEGPCAASPTSNPSIDLALALYFGQLAVQSGRGTEAYLEAAGHHFETGLRSIIAQELERILPELRQTA